MNYSSTRLRSGFGFAFRATFLPFTVTMILWLTRANAITISQLVLCLALFALPWYSYIRWKEQKREQLPIFAIIGFMYWLYYALAMFWSELIIEVARTAFGREAPPDMLTQALAMCLVGICCLWIGMRARLGQFFVPHRVPELTMDRTHRNYLRAVLVISGVLGMIEPSLNALGEGGRQLVSLAISFIPLLAFTLLFRLYLRGEASRADKILIVAFLITRWAVGLSSGWLGAGAAVITIGALTYLAERRRIPRLGVVTVILFTLFFQVGKQDFRAVYWTDQAKATQVDRVSFWVKASMDKWSDAFEDPSGQSFRLLLNQSLSRVSLLTQAANVLEQTPSVVPYQYGELYAYLFVTFIPRAVWPDKPSVNDANRFYQIAYGVTAEEDLDKVSIGVGVLTESFINFGWFGVVGVMFLLGVFFDFYRRAFLSESSGLLMSSLGIALLPQMLSIESQMATYIGGIVQQVGFSLLILLPILKWQTTRPRVLPSLRVTA
jgi:hypothetical protein